MSSSYRLVGNRWAAKEMRVLKWLKSAGERCQHDEPICVASVDGRPTPISFHYDDPPAVAGIYYTLVDEGEEVGPDGALFEYSLQGRTLADPELHQTRLDTLRLRPPRTRFTRRENYCPVFLSYRRADSGAYAGRLHESLSRSLGPDSVFMDMFDTQPGDHYEWAIQQAVAHTRAMVLVIGPRWSSIKKGGLRRIKAPGDVHAREIAAAIDRHIPIFPVFVGEAKLLKRNDLPNSIAGLETRQAFRLTSERWATDVSDLVCAIQVSVDVTPVAAFQPSELAVPEDQWSALRTLSHTLLMQPAMRSVLVLMAQSKEPGVTELLRKYAASENDSEARRLTRSILNKADIQWGS